MDAISRRQADRVQTMAAAFELANGSPRQRVQVSQIAERMGVDTARVLEACHYLAAGGLVDLRVGIGGAIGHVGLTHLGVTEWETAQANPDVATEHFPARTTVQFFGDVVGSTIQIGSPGAVQSYAYRPPGTSSSPDRGVET